MGYNLPPGVSENDLPGNRPQDLFWDKMFLKLPESIQEEIDSGSEKGKYLEERFNEYVQKIFTPEDMVNEMRIVHDVEYDELKEAGQI